MLCPALAHELTATIYFLVRVLVFSFVIETVPNTPSLESSLESSFQREGQGTRTPKTTETVTGPTDAGLDNSEMIPG